LAFAQTRSGGRFRSPFSTGSNEFNRFKGRTSFSATLTLVSTVFPPILILIISGGKPVIVQIYLPGVVIFVKGTDTGTASTTQTDKGLAGGIFNANSRLILLLKGKGLRNVELLRIAPVIIAALTRPEHAPPVVGGGYSVVGGVEEVP
jgi:hypothetical protein